MGHVFTIITGLILSIVTAWVTVQLSLRRFRAERMWDRRVDAYQTVLEALHNWSSNCRAAKARERSQIEDQLTEAEQEKFLEATAEIHKAIDLGSFLLSDEATTCLRELTTNLLATREAHKEEDHLGYFTATGYAIDHCLERLQDVAKKDLKKLRI